MILACDYCHAAIVPGIGCDCTRLISVLPIDSDDSCSCIGGYQHEEALLALLPPDWESAHEWIGKCACQRHQSFLDRHEADKLDDLTEIYYAELNGEEP